MHGLLGPSYVAFCPQWSGITQLLLIPRAETSKVGQEMKEVNALLKVGSLLNLKLCKIAARCVFTYLALSVRTFLQSRISTAVICTYSTCNTISYFEVFANGESGCVSQTFINLCNSFLVCSCEYVRQVVYLCPVKISCNSHLHCTTEQSASVLVLAM